MKKFFKFGALVAVLTAFAVSVLGARSRPRPLWVGPMRHNNTVQHQFGRHPLTAPPTGIVVM